MLRFKCYGLRFEWLKLKFNSGFYPREGRYQGSSGSSSSSISTSIGSSISLSASNSSSK